MEKTQGHTDDPRHVGLGPPKTVGLRETAWGAGREGPAAFWARGTMTQGTEPMQPGGTRDNYNGGHNIVGRETQTPGNY